MQQDLDFDDLGISPEHVEKIIQYLYVDKAPNIDGVSYVVMPELAYCFASPLVSLFNLCLDSDKCPIAWKKAVIKPLHKSGLRSDFSNYRPVSNTSNFLESWKK